VPELSSIHEGKRAMPRAMCPENEVVTRESEKREEKNKKLNKIKERDWARRFLPQCETVSSSCRKYTGKRIESFKDHQLIELFN